MELILVSDSKLKIMLTHSDMTRFDIPCNFPETDSEQFRSAFREILHEARDRTGFNTTGDRLYIQYYPSREGGCELFVTKLGHSSPGDSTLPFFGNAQSVGLAEPEPVAAPTESQRIIAYAFPSVTILISACRRLAELRHVGKSAAWRGDEGNVYLFLYGMNRICTGLSDPYSFLSEYGSLQNADSLLLYIQEHGEPICEEDAVKTLGSF